MSAATMPKLPTWYRVLAIIVGVLSIAVALIVLVDPVLAIWLLIFLLALGLLFMGMDRLAAGITGHPMGHMISVVAVNQTPVQTAPLTPNQPPSKP